MRAIPRGHQFSLLPIVLFLDLVLKAATSLRAAGNVLEILRQRLPGLDSDTPCANTGRLWLLRVGLYELQRPKPRADDWVWLIDHTIQWGARKCLFVVGVRLDEWNLQRRPLSHQDLQLLALEPVEKSDGETVCRQLSELQQQVGTPREILCDGGGDLQRGVRLFRQQHSAVVGAYDILHKLALFLEKILQRAPRWEQFLGRVASCQKRTRYTRCAFLSPPTIRERCRYMNLPDLLRWADQARQFLDDPRRNNGHLVEKLYVNLDFAWLREFDAELDEWRTLLEIMEATLHYIRREGYHRAAAEQLAALLTPLSARHDSAQALVEKILGFVRDQSAAVRDEQRLVGSTECLESLIGRAKRLLGPHARHGMTRMILAAAATLADHSPDAIRTALEAVDTKAVEAWSQRWLGKTVQSLRCAFYRGNQTCQNKSGITPPPAENGEF